jgi:hypothetical protein
MNRRDLFKLAGCLIASLFVPRLRANDGLVMGVADPGHHHQWIPCEGQQIVHNRSIYDPGHSHSIYDPGHYHGIGYCGHDGLWHES